MFALVMSRAVQGVTSNFLLFADGTDPKVLQKDLDLLVRNLKRLGLAFNASKCKIMMTLINFYFTLLYFTPEPNPGVNLRIGAVSSIPTCIFNEVSISEIKVFPIIAQRNIFQTWLVSLL